MYETQCNDIISNIGFIRMFFTLFSNKNNYNKIRLTENWNTYFSNNNIVLFVFLLFCHRGWKMKSFLFPDNDFRTLAFLFCQSWLCVTFTSGSTPSFGMLLSKLSNRNAHVCTSSIRMIRFFLPFSVNCSQVTMFQIMPALWPHGQGEGSGQPNVDKPAQGEEGSQKFPKLCGHPLWMTPKGIIKNL